MRAADAAEKITVTRPELLKPHKLELLGLLDEAEQIELRWHLALMAPRLALTVRRTLEQGLRTGTAAMKGCATYRWNLSRATCLPVIFKLAIEMAAAESQDRVCSSNGPEHS